MPGNEADVERGNGLWRVVVLFGALSILVTATSSSRHVLPDEITNSLSGSRDLARTYFTAVGIGYFLSLPLMPLAGAAAELAGARKVLLAGVVLLLGGLGILRLFQATPMLVLGGALCGIGAAAACSPLLLAFAAQRVRPGRARAAIFAVAMAPLIGNALMLLARLWDFPRSAWESPNVVASLLTMLGTLLDPQSAAMAAVRQWPWQSLAVAGILLLLLSLAIGRAPRAGLPEWKTAIASIAAERSTWLLLAGCLISGIATFVVSSLVFWGMQHGFSAVDLSRLFPTYFAGGLTGLWIALLARRGRLKGYLVAGALLQALVFLGLAFLALSIAWLHVLLFLFGLVSFTVIPIAAAVVARCTGALGLPTLVGTIGAAYGVGSVFGGPISNMADAVGYRIVFLCAALVCAIAAVAYFYVREGEEEVAADTAPVAAT